MEGWIKIHRKTRDHWLFKNSNYFRAWVIILFVVNYESKKVLIGGSLIECGRGQSLLSIDSWVDLFGVSKKEGAWTYQKVRTFFDLLEKDEIILRESISNTTRITVCNYDYYQDYQQASNNQITSKQQASNNQITTTKERKERKEIKNNIKLLSELKSSDFEDPTYFDITISFYELFKKNIIQAGGSISTIEKANLKWIDHIRLLIEVDKQSIEAIKIVWRFLNTNDFWKSNILSTSKLREKFNTLLLKANENGTNKGNNKSSGKNGATDHELAEVVSKHFGLQPVDI